MIAYSFSIQGKSHIERGVVCQDYSIHMVLCDGWHLGVIADGVGSASHSDIGSKFAVEKICEYCQKHIKVKMTTDELQEMLYYSYKYAYEEMSRYAKDAMNAVEEYDTTLSAVLYDGTQVVYGHAGDGGILVRLCDGHIKPITKRQKGADGYSVIPLRAGDCSWDFGTVKEKTASVLLATDGMLDGIFQPSLINLPEDISSLVRGDFSNNNAYITASEFFMNPHGVYQNPAIYDADSFMLKYMQGNLDREDQEPFLDCIRTNYIKMFGRRHTMKLCKGISKYYYAVWGLKNITDDKSVVCIMNEKAVVLPQRWEYYQEPDWKWRRDNYNALLYGNPMPPLSSDEPSHYNNTRNITYQQKDTEQMIVQKDMNKCLKWNIKSKLKVWIMKLWCRIMHF